eukprot:COSAG06_NODE_835_length_12032_cov_5.757060_1_plen_115_part_10
MDGNDTALASLGDSIASVVPVASVGLSVSGEITEDVTNDIIAALAATMGVSAASMTSKGGGPPVLVCAAMCCDDSRTDPPEPMQCDCGDPPSFQSDSLDACASAAADAGRRRRVL